MDVKQFEVLSLVPSDFSHPGLAVATARAGGVGIIDLEHGRDDRHARHQFERLLSATTGQVGLRITPGSVELAAELLPLAGERALTLMLAGLDAGMAASLNAGPLHRLLAEILSPDEIDAIGYEVSGFVAKGHEAGGWVGDDTAYILAQKLLGKVSQPVYIRGGVGLHTAAGLRIAGAAGVVLDDQLLLLDESALPEPLKNELSRLNGAETKLFGDLVGAPCRVYARPNSVALKAAEAAAREAEGGALDLAAWRKDLGASLGWSAEALMPLGQGIGIASTYRERYRRVGKLVQALRLASEQFIESAHTLNHLAPGAPLAASHGTRFPIAQGPMTRVSDSPEFAVDVAEGGGLPFLALALMRGGQVREMLESTRRQIGDKPWGVGMLGFIPQSLRDEQCEAIWQCKPPFALIAGGRPDQAAQFESRGIATYIHAPAPALLKMYVEQGAKRFVFEGRECGGHIGPIASFPLWEQMIEVLMAEVKPGTEGDFHLLFAGGIHDARSAAVIGAMTAPLAARGFKVGVLMGTAYLFTQEIVSSGAVVEGFQTQALACRRTMSLETGPGHSTRCVDTQFAHDFYAARRQLLREGKSADEIRDELEDLNMGRLRIASKGVNRNEEGRIVEIAPDQQLNDGMYMIGQVATMRDAALPIEELHLEVCDGASAVLANWNVRRDDVQPQAAPSDIAIVGVGNLLPQALAVDEYWNNILRKVCVLQEVPKDRWDWQLYFDADRAARDKVYSRWGGFLGELPFDPMIYGIPPKSMKAIDPMQLLTLEVARRALADAGFADGGFDRENTSIILGTSGGLGDLGTQYAVRSEIPRYIEDLSDDVWERLPEWTEESFAGSLLNVVAGRVANRLDFGGVNFTVDAACASSLAAIAMGVNELETGRSNVVVAGGIDTVQSAFGFLCFSKTQALSPDGTPRTFDESANGIAISEGLATIVMKRLADAERDGDRIYAVIKAVSGSSDGKALGMTAPRPEGQMRALKRAYAKAGFSPATLGMAEAHGTGTPVGDRAEAKTITHTLQAEGAPAKSVSLGSVKTLLGHTKASAGVAGLIKVAMSLYHRTLPPHFGVSKPIDIVADPEAPVYLLKDARPWLAHPDHPRRGGASAFGFGGTNFHAVLEEYRDGFSRPEIPGSAYWPHELFLFRAKDAASLKADVQRVQSLLSTDRHLPFSVFAASVVRDAEMRRGQACAAAFAARDYDGLAADLAALLAHLDGAKPLPPHIKYAAAVPAEAPAIGLLFPGQGAQYVGMGCEPAVFVEELRAAMEQADRVLADRLATPLSRLVWPEAAFTPDEEKVQLARLTDTRHAQPALGALSLGYWRLAQRLGLKPVAAAGHSYGEYGALMAAGVLDADTFLTLSAVRGAAMGQASSSGVAGGMAAVQGERSVVESHLAAFAGVKVANHNTPKQSVISGPAEQVDAAVKALAEAGLRATRLAVSGAFHTELVAGAQAPLSEAIAAATFRPADFGVYSNTLGARYPEAPAEMSALLDRHMLSSVEFVKEIEAMYADGVRLFVELGPKSICSNMAGAILSGRDARAVSLDGQGGGLRGLLSGIAELLVAGVPLEVQALFAERGLQAIATARLAEAMKAPALSKTTWMLSGGCARPLNDPIVRTGKLPALTVESRDAARAKREAERPVTVREVPVAAPSAVPAAAAPAMPAAAMPGASDAIGAYQETMRQFLALQERVISQFLGAGAVAPVQGPGLGDGGMATAAPAPAATVAESGIGNRESAVPAAASVPAVEAVVPMPQSPAPSPRSVDYKSTLLAIVAERTGYPEDMLDLDSDLEADLGIDSIKRVEIAGAVQKQLPAAVGEAMQAQMETFTRAKSLNAIIAALETLAPPAAAAPAAESGIGNRGAVVLAVAAPAVDYKSTLLAIVAERTGYPEDMLDLDADLEADLGIDSIKRVEIAGAVQKQLPAAVGEAMQAQMETFTRAKSLNAIITALETLAPPAAAPAVPIPQSPSPSPRSVDYKETLLAIVAERTGYPEDMLDLDADLEADLGIDSIKRVEIAGAVQKQLPAAVGEAMQAQMETFTRAKSLNAIIAALETLAPPAAAPAVPIPQSPSPSPRSVDYKETLLAIVAERTGYPEDMLDLDADLEADLGIDSIKRVEIAGAVQKQLPAAVGEAMQAQMETFTRAKSLNAIIAALETLAPVTAPAVPDPRSPIPDPGHEGGEAAEVPRYVIRPQAVPAPGRAAALKGLVLVCGAEDEVRAAVSEQLVAQGATVVAIDATTPQAFASAVADARQANGAVQGVVHLYGLEPLASEAFEDWQLAGQRSVFSLFHLAQALLPELDGVRLVAATRLGGTFGRTAVGNGAAIGGGVAGLVKCLRHEYPNGRFRVADFNGQTEATIATRIVDELLADDALPEVGYIGDSRYATTTVEDALQETAFAPQLTPAGDWVVLATGGARGITAGLLEEISKSGMRMVLVGRSPEPAAEAPGLADAADAAALKQKLIAQARDSGEKLKPADLEKRLGKLLADREIRGNLARLRDAGVSVDYRACDVRDAQAFGALIDAVYKDYGRIDAVLHGAGVIEDKLLRDKSVESFDRVFGTKLDSAWTLAHKLQPDSLKLLVFFTSVAGRYGNQGQSDYACANEAINRLAWQLSRNWSETRVIAANWGPWDAGMASEGVKRQFRERGMEPIPLAAGRRYFVNELAYGPKNEVEIVIGAGPWQQIDGLAPQAGAVEEAPAVAGRPLIREPLRMGAGGALVLSHHFTKESDPYIGDHIIEGRWVLPAAGAAEWMAQTVAEGWSGWQVAEVRDVRPFAGVVLDPELGRKVEIKARASTHSSAGEQMITVDMSEPGKKAPLYRGAVRLVERLDEAAPAVPAALSGGSLDVAKVYSECLFHTGRFQLLDSIPALTAEGVDATVRPSTPAEWFGGEGQWLFDPGLVDVAAQLAWVWGREQRGASALPARFGRIVRYGQTAPTGPLKLKFRIRPASHDQAVAYDAWFIDAAGQVVLAVLDAESTLSASLNRIAGTPQ